MLSYVLRVILTAFAHLIALNARTGTPIATFGSNGWVDLNQGLRRTVNRDYYTMSSPSSVPGESAASTQPYPTRPAPIDVQGVREEDLIDLTPALRKEALEIVAQYDHGPLYTPPSRRGTIQVPGIAGGASWSGAAIDPETGMLLIQPIVWRVPVRSSSKSQLIDMPQPARQLVPTAAGLVHHPSLMNAGEGCRAVASQSDAKAGLILPPNELPAFAKASARSR